MRQFQLAIISVLLMSNLFCSAQESKSIRFATFNTSLYRDSLGQIEKDLESKENEQMKVIAEIIQRNNPDVLALQEFDYAADNKYLKLFMTNYLEVSHNNSTPVTYKFAYAFESNTGILTSFDLNKDGKYNTANDAFGYGKYPGQYAFAILSKYPIDEKKIRTFRLFLWKDMPQANLPFDMTEKRWYYSNNELDQFRLSSKSHVDVPIIIGKDTIHALIAHPTPPVFDGPEDRNGKRNYDEIRLLADYISGNEKADYIYDDKGTKGGLKPGSHFVIMGDMNADPVDGDSFSLAIRQLTENPVLNQEASTGKHVPKSLGSKKLHERKPDMGDPLTNTSDFGLRIDYVLPSKTLILKDSGVFWPIENENFHYLIDTKQGTDHRLVWVDLIINLSSK